MTHAQEIAMMFKFLGIMVGYVVGLGCAVCIFDLYFN